jgi:hypothetical protein
MAGYILHAIDVLWYPSLVLFFSPAESCFSGVLSCRIPSTGVESDLRGAMPASLELAMGAPGLLLEPPEPGGPSWMVYSGM